MTRRKCIALPNFMALLITVALAVITCSNTALAADAPIWQVSMAEKVKWQVVSPTGNLLVCAKDALMALDPIDGSVQWQVEGLKGIDRSNFKIIPMTTYALANTGKSYSTQSATILFDYVTGQEIWSTKDHDIKDTDTYYVVPHLDAILVFGWYKNRDRAAIMLELDSGDILWDDRDFLKNHDPMLYEVNNKETMRGSQSPVFDTPETMLTLFSKKSLRKWNTATGELIWETNLKLKEIPARASGFAPMLLSSDNSIVYVPNKEKIFAVRTSDGLSLWEDQDKVKDRVFQMALVPGGLLVRSGDAETSRLMLLNLKNGQKLWEDEVKLKHCSGFIVEDNRAVIYADKKLYAVNLADGQRSEMAKDLKFKDSEVPRRITATENGYFLNTSQNMMFVTRDGSQVYHTYSKRPGKGLMGSIASAVVESVVDDVGESIHFEADGQAAASALLDRYVASQDGEQSTYKLTEVKIAGDKGPGLMKINNLTGQTEDAIILDDKSPVYAVDEIDALLYFARDEKLIECFKF